ncbi:unnamed protein product [Ceratitis capitata]|uniref:(Mediterranean fruit fly) hypothetical protein n=1 Tax=Ceratitis capitata TaxID=7213 RepID=A0A811ULJ4_CERCA|nr:unnamed protein product [Ceratitis capitata]
MAFAGCRLSVVGFWLSAEDKQLRLTATGSSCTTLHSNRIIAACNKRSIYFRGDGENEHIIYSNIIKRIIYAYIYILYLHIYIPHAIVLHAIVERGSSKRGSRQL